MSLSQKEIIIVLRSVQYSCTIWPLKTNRTGLKSVEFFQTTRIKEESREHAQRFESYCGGGILLVGGGKSSFGTSPEISKIDCARADKQDKNGIRLCAIITLPGRDSCRVVLLIDSKESIENIPINNDHRLSLIKTKQIKQQPWSIDRQTKKSCLPSATRTP